MHRVADVGVAERSEKERALLGVFPKRGSMERMAKKTLGKRDAAVDEIARYLTRYDGLQRDDFRVEEIATIKIWAILILIFNHKSEKI